MRKPRRARARTYVRLHTRRRRGGRPAPGSTVAQPQRQLLLGASASVIKRRFALSSAFSSAEFHHEYKEGRNHRTGHYLAIPEGSSTTLTNSLSHEMSTNFGEGPLSIGSTTSISFSSEWSTSESKTWSESTEVEVQIGVPAKKKVEISQILGEYGPMTIYSSHYRVDYSDV